VTAHDSACKRCHGSGIVCQAFGDPPEQCDCGPDDGPPMTAHDELRARALAATPGPWADTDGTVYAPLGSADARFIAAASPDVVLALLDEIAALRAERDGYALAMDEQQRTKDRERYMRGR
jgi:hypothetical protein